MTALTGSLGCPPDRLAATRDGRHRVAGGSSGIGQAIAIRLGQEGATVAVNWAIAQAKQLIAAAGLAAAVPGG